MKRITILTAVIFLLTAGMYVYADPVVPGTSQIISRHVQTSYNAYGVAISSTETITTTTTTTNTITVNNQPRTITSTTTSTQTVTSNWKGGSLKVSSIEISSRTTNEDEADYTTNSTINYEYNDDGQLKSASGSADSNGNRGKDARSQDLGTFTSHTDDTYTIKNGQALRASSTNTQTNTGADGQVQSTSTDGTNYEYELKGGSWVLKSESSRSVTNETNGGSTTINKTQTYQRDASGVITGISQTATGETIEVTGRSGANATQRFTMQNYNPNFQFDAQQGWYLAGETYDWVLTPGTTSGAQSQSDDPAVNGKLILSNGNLLMSVDSITDFNGTKPGEGKLVWIVADAGQEAEFEALKQLVASKGGKLDGYTIYGVYQGEGAEDYTAHTFIFQGIGYGPFQP